MYTLCMLLKILNAEKYNNYNENDTHVYFILFYLRENIILLNFGKFSSSIDMANQPNIKHKLYIGKG